MLYTRSMSAIVKKNKGFTIIELLIVIVVIGILAAITIVAYNGIQQRARNAQVTSGVNAYVKAIESHKVVKGEYPTVSGCLGANYPSNNCWTTGGSATWSVNATLDSQLSEFIPNKPTLATSLLEMGPSYPGYFRAGFIYNFTSSAYIEMRYYLAGSNQSCSVSGFTAATEGYVTYCSKVITN